MLHNEARKLLVQAYEKGHKAEIVAMAYSVTPSTVYRLARQQRRTGSVALRTSQRGRKAKLTETDLEHIDGLLQKQPDLTIDEIIETLGLVVSNPTVRRAVIKLGYTRKKKMIHASEQERPRCVEKTQRVENYRVRTSH